VAQSTLITDYVYELLSNLAGGVSVLADTDAVSLTIVYVLIS